ncbi:rhamnogalacturonan acetylesterase [Agarivorans sp. QJM3NY_29]|uniref:rhamnogalacturonan acetylesterase n=1 Tax=unclassified Agarivorans TaxID=2636026 RepID=UPI003D7DA03F
MNKTITILLAMLLSLSFSVRSKEQDMPSITIYLVGDSTMTDYSLESAYMSHRYPLTGWGQVLQPLLTKDNLADIALISGEQALVDDRAKGGRSSRTFFEEGRWEAVYHALQPNDLVLIQFGHNDAALEKPERYVNIQGYQQFLRLFVAQTRQKQAVPILVTPVTRNYPWSGAVLGSAHGAYPAAMKEVAKQLQVDLIDLTSSSAKYFSQQGRDYVTEHYFMNLPAGIYQAYPEGKSDNTHFQPEGAKVVAALVLQGLKQLQPHSKLVQ